RSGRLYVPVEHEERARIALAANGAVEDVQRNGRPGAITVVLTGAEPTLNEAVRSLVDADVPIIAFELEGARLSDAFLAITGRGEWPRPQVPLSAWTNELTNGATRWPSPPKRRRDAPTRPDGPSSPSRSCVTSGSAVAGSRSALRSASSCA